MQKTEMLNRLAWLFQTFGYTWQVAGKQIVPDQNDLEKTLDKARMLLYAEPVPSQLEVGQLIVRRWADKKFDVYLRIGEYNDNDG